MKLILLMSFLVAASASVCVHHEFKYLQPSLMISCFSATLFLLTLVAIIFHQYLKTQPCKVYLVDFACYKPNDDSCAITKDMLKEAFKNYGVFSEENVQRMENILDKCGLGPKTYVPQAIMQRQKLCLVEARKETETVIFGAIDELLDKTWVRPNDIGILVVNSTIFCPTPSLCDIIVNRYKLRHNVLCFDLGGMGCSGGVLAIDLAKRLLQSHPNSYAMVVSTENTNNGAYLGNNLSMLAVNCVFRMGGSASLLSNHPSDRQRSKYQMIHTLRTHSASDDRSYNCIFQQDDDQHIIGISVSTNLTNVAGQVLKSHIASLAPLVLPVSEKLKFLVTFVGSKVLGLNIEAYVPNFKLAFDHFCIHTGATPVLDKMQKKLELRDWDMEPSRMTLYKFGNTSASSVWYELAYCEAKGRIKKGDRIWQLQFGAGFKCNSAVWVALNNVEGGSLKNPWRDDIHEFPVKVVASQKSWKKLITPVKM